MILNCEMPIFLASVRIPFSDPRIHRSLTAEEEGKHRSLGAVVNEAEERLRMFRILDANYSQWEDCLRILLQPKPSKWDDDLKLELDRLLLNYLASSYTIREHFAVSFNRRFRKDPAKSKDYDNFLMRLYAFSWATAFFTDFRDHVQHHGVGIGTFNRQVTLTSVRLTVTANAADLCKDARGWSRSKLTPSKGILQLVPLMREFHVQMKQSFAGFVVNTFFPELVPAADFYAKLTAEVHSTAPGTKMYFTGSKPRLRKEGANTKFNFKLTVVPNDLFAELSIYPVTPVGPVTAKV